LPDQPDMSSPRKLLAWDVHSQKALIITLVKRGVGELGQQWYELWDTTTNRMIWATIATRPGDDTRILMCPKFAPHGDSFLFHKDDKLYVIGSLSDPSHLKVKDTVGMRACPATQFEIHPEFSRIAVCTQERQWPFHYVASSSPAGTNSIRLRLDRVTIHATDPVTYGCRYSKDGRLLHFMVTQRWKGFEFMTYRVREDDSFDAYELEQWESTFCTFGDGAVDTFVRSGWAPAFKFQGDYLLVWLQGERYFGGLPGLRSFYGVKQNVSSFLAIHPPDDRESRPRASNPVVTKRAIHLLPDGQFVDIDTATIIDWPSEWNRGEKVFSYPEGVNGPRPRDDIRISPESEAVEIREGRLVMISIEGGLYYITMSESIAPK
jgi:hypothetical protein